MDKTLVSIIIPIYNVEKYLKRCLVSCVNQTLEEIEIILVNDASPDNCHLIMEEYKEKYPEKVVCLYQDKNMRQGAARNRGVKIAKGQFVTFVDSDDWIQPNMCEVLYKKAIQDDSDIVFCDVLRETKTGYRVTNRFDETLTGVVDTEKIRELVLQLYVGPCAHLIKKEIILDNELFFPEEVICEDTAITRMWDIYAKKITKVSEALYTYCLNSESVGQRKWKEYLTDGFVCIKLLADNLDACPKIDAFESEKEIICLYYIFSVIDLLIKSYGENCLEQIDRDAWECINHVCSDNVKKNEYWDYWFTPVEQKYLLKEIELQDCLQRRTSEDDYYDYYLSVKDEIGTALEQINKTGEKKIGIWSKTNYAKAFNKIYNQYVIVDNLDEIENHSIDLIIALRSVHMQNIKYESRGKVSVFNMQKYLLTKGKMERYLWEKNIGKVFLKEEKVNHEMGR